MIFWATLMIWSSVTKLKSSSLSNPLRLSIPLECSFKPRCAGMLGSAKNIDISWQLHIVFQFENSLPQSKVIDLNIWEGKAENIEFRAFSISVALRPKDRKVIIILDTLSTKVMIALPWRPTIVSPSRCPNSLLNKGNASILSEICLLKVYPPLFSEWPFGFLLHFIGKSCTAKMFSLNIL